MAAVALAITAVAFLAIRNDLQNQVREEVAARADSVRHERRLQFHGHIPEGWVPPHSTGGFANLAYTQVIASAGQVRAPPGDLQAAHPERGRHRRSQRPARTSFYSFARVNNIRAMVYTEQIGPGLAIQVAEALGATNQEVSSIGTMLAALSVVGVLSATLLGWAVARAGLAPVNWLAGVAEEATRPTGDPGRRVVGRGRYAQPRTSSAGGDVVQRHAGRRFSGRWTRAAAGASAPPDQDPARQPPHQRRPAPRAPGDARRRSATRS